MEKDTLSYGSTLEQKTREMVDDAYNYIHQIESCEFMDNENKERLIKTKLATLVDCSRISYKVELMRMLTKNEQNNGYELISEKIFEEYKLLF